MKPAINKRRQYLAKASAASLKKSPVLDAVASVKVHINPKLIRAERIGFIVLDEQMRYATHITLSTRCACITDAVPQRLIDSAHRQQAATVIVFHVIPDGDAIPSKSDISLAEKIVKLGRRSHLEVIDYVVISRTDATSLLDLAVRTACAAGSVQEYAEQMTLSSILAEQPQNWPPQIPAQPVSGKPRTLWAIDLFAGCGGLSLGLEQAGFTPLLASELNHDAMATYMANRQHNALSITSFYDVHAITDDKLEELKTGWKKLGIDEIDLIAGGPPCQGYSGIGHRRSYKVEKEKIPSNFLFKEMTRIISKLRPRMFLFENVKGLLSARWTANGKKGEIWEAVQKAFRELNGGEYLIDFKLVQAKDYGVPQNRPRVLMAGIRKDLGWNPDVSATASGLLPSKQGIPPSIEDMLSDLVDPGYLGKKETERYLCPPKTEVQKRLRTSKDGTVVAPKGAALKDQEYSEHKPLIREKFQYMLDHNGEIPVHMQTKKFAQRVLPRVWGANGPTITVTSLPEDYVHFVQPRALTVREWARLQMFPDWYEFKGPRTTGGVRRAGNPHQGVWDRECPKYTQIGNAVPVELARKVGVHLSNILREVAK